MTDGVDTIVLHDDVGLAQLADLARQEGWTLVGETAGAHWVLATRRWQTETGVKITHVFDHPGGTHWLRLTGVQAKDRARRLRARLPHHTENELLDIVLQAAEPDPVACIRAASKIAAYRPAAFELRHLAALEKLLGHSSVAVRRAGIRSAYGCRWPELRELVKRRREQEQRLVDQLADLDAYLTGDVQVDAQG